MSEVTTQHTSDWQPTACNLCYANCGILVKTGGPHGHSIIKVKGDRYHPASRGYICNKVAH